MICGTCGFLPCRCKKVKCSGCSSILNVDAIGESIAAWNLKHQTFTGCKGKVEYEEDEN